jgi:hypothetical protein
MRKIGYSTGSFYQLFPTYSAEAVEAAQSFSPSVLELFVGMTSRLAAFQSFDSLDIQSDYLSVHAPTDIRYNHNKESESVFEKLALLSNSLQPDVIIFHPDTVDDWSLFQEAPFPVGFENMDHLKQFGVSPKELEKVLDRDNAFRFVFDVQHLYTHDPEMKDFQAFVDMAGDRLVQIHLSGCRLTAQGHLSHDAIHLSKETIILDKVRELLDPDVPILIESPVTSIEAATLEFDYINTALGAD